MATIFQPQFQSQNAGKHGFKDHQLSKVQRGFGDDILDLKLRCCQRQLSSLSSGNNIFLQEK